MCLYPKIIKNRKYTSTKKNGGVIPAVKDERVQYVPVGCGQCIECRKQKARGWQVRLLEDLKQHKNGHFVTLTFSDESIAKLKEENETLEGYELDNEIATRAIRLFLERWRKKYKTSLRHWLVTELGHNGTENIHLHGIIWTNESLEEVREIWGYGYMWPRKENIKKTWVNEQTINYIIKYIHKIDDQHKTFKSKVLTSPGIGANYTDSMDVKKNQYKDKDTIETYRTRTGHKIAMPIYWRNKIYSDDEREKLWLQRLDKQERWICGEKVDISKGEEEYYKLLQFYRAKNKKLGYGTDEKDWSRQHYEKQRRILMIRKRIQNAKEKIQ